MAKRCTVGTRGIIVKSTSENDTKIEGAAPKIKVEI